MPGLGMGLNLQQRLSQRLEQKLDNTLKLSLAMIQAFHTSGEEGTGEQNVILEKLAQDVRNHVYSDWEDFHERCMKRIKKEDRSENVKELIGALRGIVERTQPSIDDIRTLLNIGMYARINHEIPKVVYMHMDDSLKTEAAQSLEDKVELIRIGRTLQRNKGSLTAAYEFLHSTSEGEKFSAPEQYAQIVSEVSRLSQEKADAIIFVNKYFERVLEGRESVDGDAILSGFEFVEQLHQLTKERVQKKYVSDGRDLLARDDFSDQRQTYSNIPTPILANLVRTGLSDDLLDRANGVFGQKYLSKNTDPRRRVFRSLYALDSNPKKRKVLEHLLTSVDSAEYVSKILGHLEILQESGNFTYFFDETDGVRIIRKLNDYAINRNLQMLGLSEEYKEKIAENPHRIIANNLLTMISTFGGVLVGSYQNGIPLLREITEHIVDDDFQTWRYTHDKSRKQLKCLEYHEEGELAYHVVEAWRNNATSERLIGDIDKLQPRINAMKIVADELKGQYQTVTNSEATVETLQGLEQRIMEISDAFRTGGKHIDNKKALGQEKRTLLAQYETLQAILKVESADPETFLNLGQDVDRAIGKTSYEDMKMTFGEVKKILDSPDVKNLERVAVVETDAPYKLFDVGRTPVQSCQRWTERTGYNKCLLAYVADSNKKLYQVLDENGNVIVRSIVRLMQFDKESPVLLVEGPYATRWTRDYGRVLFAQVAQRALGLNEALGEPIAIASNDRRIQEVMADFGKQYDSKLHSKEYERKLPESKNGFEYSDSLGGCLSSGSKIRRELKYFFIASK